MRNDNVNIISEAKRRRRAYNPLLEKNLELKNFSKSALEKLNTPEEVAENIRLLDICSGYWNNLRDMRDRRVRVRNFLNGEQWSDSVGKYGVTEEDVIRNDGNYPAKYNIMQPILKNMLGQFRGSQKKSIVLIRERDRQDDERILTNAIQSIHELNSTSELDTQLVSERWMSGVIAQRITYDWWRDRDQSDVLIENCETSRVFFNTDVRDVRLLDMHTCGMLFDYSLEDLTADKEICKSMEDVQFLARAYGSTSQEKTSVQDNLMSAQKQDMLDFYIPLDVNKCRVIEVWYEKVERKMYLLDTETGLEYITDHSAKEVKKLNEDRKKMVYEKNVIVEEYNKENPDDTVPLFEYFPIEYEERFEKTTYFKKITPSGLTLQKGESPFWHQGTPYVFEVRPLIDGDIQGEGCQLIDIQKQYNRFRLLMDVAIRNGIKGVVLVPDTAVPDGWEAGEYVRELKRMDGYIVYKVKSKDGIVAKPEQLSNSIPIQSMLQAMSHEMKQMMSDVSGTSQALLGRDPKSGTPAALYSMESSNAAVNAIDFFKSFEAFQRRRDSKILKTIQQFYPEVRSIVTLGMETNTDILEYRASKLADLDTDVMVVGASTNLMEKADQESDLRQMVLQGMLPMEIWLKNSTLPYARILLKDIEEMKNAVDTQQPTEEEIQQAQLEAQQLYNNENKLQ